MKINALRTGLFLIGLVLSSIPSFSQLYTTKIEHIRKLVDIAQRVPVLDSLVASQDREISRMVQIIHADSVVKVARAQAIEAITREMDAYKGLYEAQLKLTDLEKKEKRRWKRRTFGAVIVTAGVLILSLKE